MTFCANARCHGTDDHRHHRHGRPEVLMYEMQSDSASVRARLLPICQALRTSFAAPGAAKHAEPDQKQGVSFGFRNGCQGRRETNG
jgi:hypothetical protein